jgi:hypothetical protein
MIEVPKGCINELFGYAKIGGYTNSSSDIPKLVASSLHPLLHFDGVVSDEKRIFAAKI